MENNETNQITVKEAKSKYNELKKQLKLGIVPEKWNELYKEYVAKIEDKLSKHKEDNSSFSFSFPISEDEYRGYFHGDSKTYVYSEGYLLNEFLTNKFSEEQCYSGSFELEDDVKSYPSDQDQRKYDEAMRRYNDAYMKWSVQESLSGRSVIANEISIHKNPYKKPVEPILNCSIIEHNYRVKITGDFSVKKIVAPKNKKSTIITTIIILTLLIGGLLYFFLRDKAEETLPQNNETIITASQIAKYEMKLDNTIEKLFDEESETIYEKGSYFITKDKKLHYYYNLDRYVDLADNVIGIDFVEEACSIVVYHDDGTISLLHNDYVDVDCPAFKEHQSIFNSLGKKMTKYEKNHISKVYYDSDGSEIIIYILYENGYFKQFSRNKETKKETYVLKSNNIISFTNTNAGNYIAVGTNGKIIHNLPEEELPDGELSILENWKDLVFVHVSYNNYGNSSKYHIYGVKKDGSIYGVSNKPSNGEFMNLQVKNVKKVFQGYYPECLGYSCSCNPYIYVLTEDNIIVRLQSGGKIDGVVVPEETIDLYSYSACSGSAQILENVYVLEGNKVMYEGNIIENVREIFSIGSHSSFKYYFVTADNKIVPAKGTDNPFGSLENVKTVTGRMVVHLDGTVTEMVTDHHLNLVPGEKLDEFSNIDRVLFQDDIYYLFDNEGKIYVHGNDELNDYIEQRDDENLTRLLYGWFEYNNKYFIFETEANNYVLIKYSWFSETFTERTIDISFKINQIEGNYIVTSEGNLLKVDDLLNIEEYKNLSDIVNFD